MASKAPVKAPEKKKVESKDSSGSTTPTSSEEGSSDESEEGVLAELNLSKDHVILLKNAFTAFDSDKKGVLGLDMIGTILEMLGHAQTQAELEKTVKEIDMDGSGELDFDEFCLLCSKFIVEDEEENVNLELLTSELKEAFRYYDREGNGYITTRDMREILKELDPALPDAEIAGIVNEIDADDSGTVDFDEFVKALR